MSEEKEIVLNHIVENNKCIQCNRINVDFYLWSSSVIYLTSV